MTTATGALLHGARSVLRSRYAGVGAAAIAWLLFSANFNTLAIRDGDSLIQYTLVRRLFGADVPALGYQFGLALFETPFYAVGRLLESIGIAHLAGAPATEAAVSLASTLVTLGSVMLMARLVTRLGLPHPGFASFVATFGTPLFYYGTFVPGKSHALDTFMFAVALNVLVDWARADFRDRRLLVVLGAVIGAAVAVRYYAAPAAVIIGLSLLYLRRFREAVSLTAVALATWVILFAVPASYGVHLTGGGYDSSFLGFDPTAPLKMLFTDHRGLFVWSPVALVGLLGYLSLLRREADAVAIRIAGLAGVAIWLSYASVSFWDGTWSFSQRFLTPLAPLVAIGVAAAVRLRPRLTIGVSLAAAAWTVFLAFNLTFVGPPEDDYSTIRGGASDVALQVVRERVGPGEYLWAIRARSHLLP